MREEYYVIAFDSTHYAIQGEKTLKEKEIDIKVIPTPREITASCGLSIKFAPEALDMVKRTLEDASILSKGIYRLVKDESGRSATKIN